VHECYRQTTDRQTTDGRAIAYSEREREFTFAKNDFYTGIIIYTSLDVMPEKNATLQVRLHDRSPKDIYSMFRLKKN